ncbi:lasso peptide biosynthesis PqqD family chaperone [Streptosporangium sp. NBC_01756]|uniref:lasso peptide biosynthesis PqqD family chaperone n=1 Tax=Streptosporangium sp. NBC_01756 TaxID=2975950 RepID=UPI002DDA1524|nr:lasso peptide biosynthesis PqqD family chaperone [Streptosporangium sp. NBC_01756]WSC83916.1 lasso peptide biosynthesis PqqD family chaperone [Streptosporangium sp. NBC_01756]
MAWRLYAHVTFTKTDTGAVLLDNRRGRYWQTNDTAAVVLERIQRNEDIESAVAELCVRYPDAAAQIMADVHHMLTKLAEAKLVSP